MSIRYVFLLLFSASFLVLGCAEEDTPFQKLPVAKLQNVSCLTNAAEIFDKYFISQMSEKEIEEFWDCTDRAVRLFGSYVRGKEDSQYRPREIYDFINNFFFTDLRIPSDEIESLLSEMMYFKQLLVGGNREFVTSGELVEFRNWIQFLKQETLRLRPHITRLNWIHGKAQPTPEELGKSLEVLNGVALRLGQKFGAQGYEYERVHIEALLKKMDVIFESSPEKQLRLNRWVPLAFHLKKALISLEMNKMIPSEWQSLTVILSEGLGAFLNWHYFVGKASSIYEQNAVQGLRDVKARIIQILKRGFTVEQRGKIENSNLIEIVNDLDRLDMLTKNWSRSEFSYIWLIANSALLQTSFPQEENWILLRRKWIEDKALLWEDAISGLVNAMTSQADSLFPHLTLETLDSIDRIVEDWASVQLNMNELKLFERDSGKCLNGALSSIEEMHCLTDTPWAMNVDSEGRLLFQRSKEYSPNTLSTLNWERIVIRSLIRGYGDVYGADQLPIGVSQDRLKDIFFDLKLPLIKLGLVEKDNINFYERVFLEGNLFLARSDGNEAALNYFEAVEYLHYALAGVRAGGVFLDHLEKGCEVERESNSVKSVAVECFRWNFKEHFSRYLSHIPYLVEFVSALPLESWTLFEYNLESTVRTEGTAGSPILVSDIMEIFILLQYIETFIFRYDQSQSGTIEVDETEAAHLVFAPILARLLGFDPVLQAWDLKATFTYLLKFGQSPLREDPIAGVQYLHWKWHPDQWSYRADRLRLAQILASLAKLR